MVIEKNKLHLTPVKITELDQDMLERIKNLTDNNGRLLFSQVLAGNSSYRFIKSKYDGQVTVSTTSIGRGQYYRKNDNNTMTEEYKQKLSEKINNLKIEISQTENEIAEKPSNMTSPASNYMLTRIKLIV